MAAKKEEVAAPPAPEFSPKMLMVPALMLGLRALKLDLTGYVVWLRVLYVSSTLACGLVYFYISRLAQESKETGKVEVIDKMAGDAQKRRSLSIGEYDAEEAMKKIKSSAFAVCVVAFIHYKWGSPMPLLLQSIMQPMNLTDDPLVKIYLFGKAATGKCQRPFKVANPIADLFEGKTEEAVTDDKKKA